MRCCPHCFESQTLKQFIEDNGETGDCDFCLAKSVNCLDVSDLYPLFQPLLGLYREVDYGYDYDEDGSPLDIGETLPSLIEDGWHPLFSEKFIRNVLEDESAWLESEKRDAFWTELFQDNKSSAVSNLWVEDELPEGHLNSLWPLLSEYLKRERRFIIGSEELKEGIALLPEILERASLAVRADQEWFRARVGCHTNSSGESIPFEKQEMGAPPPEKAYAGRANPHGIPFLYLATDETSALAEVRPWKGALVSIGAFRSLEEMELVDLTGKHFITDPFEFADSTSLVAAIADTEFLRTLSGVLSTPIDPDRSLIDYVPSQFLTEFIRDQGYPGIVYPSAMADGSNIVLFDEKLAICESVTLHEVKNISYLASNLASKKKI